RSGTERAQMRHARFPIRGFLEPSALRCAIWRRSFPDLEPSALGCAIWQRSFPDSRVSGTERAQIRHLAALVSRFAGFWNRARPDAPSGGARFPIWNRARWDAPSGGARFPIRGFLEPSAPRCAILFRESADPELYTLSRPAGR